MTIRGIIFDLDGTLVDSLEDITIALNHALETVGQPTRDEEWVRRHLGHGAAHLVHCAVAGTRAAPHDRDVLDEFVRYYDEHPCDTTAPYPAVREVLTALTARNLAMAVLSNKTVIIVRKVLQILDMERFFTNIWGGDSFPDRKPSPVGLQHFLELHQLQPKEMMMIGDSPADIESALNAGTLSCFIRSGYGTLDGSGIHPDHTISSLAELPGLI